MVSNVKMISIAKASATGVSTRRTHLDAVDVAVLNCSYEGSGCQR